MSEIYRRKCLVHYGQVALWDREDKNSYPATDGPLPWMGAKGICVAARNDTEVEIQVLTGEDPDDEGAHIVAEATILVGEQGLQTGNVTTASVVAFPWPKGEMKVTVYCNSTDKYGLDATCIWFVLEAVS